MDSQKNTTKHSNIKIIQCWYVESESSSLHPQCPYCLKLPAATAVIMGLHGGNSRALDSPHAKVIKKSCLILPQPSPTTGNLLIDGWGRYGKWQESLCRWFSFKCICQLAGGGKDERQLSWTLCRQKDMWDGDATSAGGEKRRMDDW